jgi:hypothetical protein
MRTARLILLRVLGCGALVGCTEYARPVPELTFAHSSPILLNVREAQIDPRYHSSAAPPNIGLTVNPTPEAALIKWAQQRLRSDGTENIARFTILKAPLTASTLPKTGFSGLFSSESGERWTLTVEAQLEILDESGNRLDGYAAKVTRTRDMEAGLTYAERNRFWYDMLSDTMAEFDAQMSAGLHQYLGKWLR